MARVEDVASKEAPDERDTEGLPIHREPTLDDVRSDGRAHRMAAVGCTAVVLALVLAFWIVRAFVIR